MIEKLLILWFFATTRWLPPPSEGARRRRLRRFLARVRRDSPFHRNFPGDPPILTKTEFLAHFPSLNRFGIDLATATEVALRAERERDFRPELSGGITVGLSSGTSGTRQVFLVSRTERCRWAGQILGRMLDRGCLARLLAPWTPPLRFAFFLRSNSNLYTTLASRRIDFQYHDLTRPFAELMEELGESPPDVLIGPATVLPEIARALPWLRPRQVVSVAEVLDPRDRALVESTFGRPVREVYQASEGFLGCSCRHGRIHLNEETLHVEPLWLDADHERFYPLVTDFTRSTQWVVRYRLDDVLRLDPTPCPCGRRTRSLRSVEGRAEEVLWLRDRAGEIRPVFPDVVRQALFATDPTPGQFRIEQVGELWRIHLAGGDPAGVRASLEAMVEGLTLTKPSFQFLPWKPFPPSEKQKRIRCLHRPE